MKYAVIGTGYWGENHVRVAAKLRDMGVVGDVVLCDVDKQRVAELADLYGFEYTTDYRELATLEVDAATVATPSPTHGKIATELLESDIDLLVEKPLAVDSKSAWNIVETADEYDRTLAVGHIFRHHPALLELKERVDRGDLGRIKYLQTNRFTFRVPRESSGALYSLAVHDIDIYRFLLGSEPDSLYCRLDSWVREDIDETATLLLEFGDTTGIINESWQVPIFGKRRDLIVTGTERSAHLDYLEDTTFELFNYRIEATADDFRSVEEGSTMHDVDDGEPLRIEVENFIGACRGNEPLRAPGHIGAETVELLELAEISSNENRVVRW